MACSEVGVPVELAVGLGFSPVKRRCLELFGAKLIGVDMLKAGKSPREVVEWHLSNSYRKLEIGGRRDLARALGTGRTPSSL